MIAVRAVQGFNIDGSFNHLLDVNLIWNPLKSEEIPEFAFHKCFYKDLPSILLSGLRVGGGGRSTTARGSNRISVHMAPISPWSSTPEGMEGMRKETPRVLKVRLRDYHEDRR